MNGGIKKPPFITGVTGLELPSLPAKPDALDMVDGGDRDPSAVPTRYMIPAIPGPLCSNPNQMLQQSLGELHKRILEDPEADDLHETIESYRVRIEQTTLPNVLSTEALIWRKYIKSDSPALVKAALEAFRLVIGNDNCAINTKEALRTGCDLLQVIGRGDLASSQQALILFQYFLERFFRNRRDLLGYEVSGFRTMAQDIIQRELGDDDADVGESMLSHLRNLLVVYSQIVFCNDVELIEIDDGLDWISRYTDQGHPLANCAAGVRGSLEMTREDLIARTQAPGQGVRVVAAPVQQSPRGNNLEPVSGEIVIKSSKTKKPE